MTSRTPWLASSCVDAVLQVVLDALDAAGERLGVDLGVGLLEAHPVDRREEAHRAAGGDHRLRRDAVPEVGGAADDVALDHRHLGAEPGGVGGRGVAGRAAADDHEASGHDVQATMAGPADLYRRATRGRADRRRRRRARRADAAGPLPGAGWPPSGPAARARSTRSAPPAREPYPYRFDRTHTSPSCGPRGAIWSRAPRPTTRSRVAGRVMLKRDTGKLVFATIARPRRRGPAVRLEGRDRRRRVRRRQGARPRRLGRRRTAP